MTEKKYSTRFTLKFSETDPQHIQTVRILNKQGHRKSQFIVNAILCYMSYGTKPPKNVGRQKDVESIMAAIQQLISDGILTPTIKEPVKTDIRPKHQPNTLPLDSGTDAGLDEDGVRAAVSALSTFRKK